MKNILITGATGFIGRQLVKLMSSGEDKLFGLSRRAETIDDDKYSQRCCDLTDEKMVKEAIRWSSPHIIVHLAGNPLVKTDSNNPCQITLDNVLATHHLLAHCENGTRFILASSATVYANNGVQDEGCPINPKSIYGATKASAEVLVNAYASLGKVSGLCCRLIANVGGCSTHGVLHDVVRKVLDKTNPNLELFGDSPGSKKPFMHVFDTCMAIAYFMKRNMNGAINIAPSDSITVEHLANIVMDVLQVYKPIKWLGKESLWAGDNPQVQIDNSNMLFFGFEPTFKSSEEAVRAATGDIACLLS